MIEPATPLEASDLPLPPPPVDRDVDLTDFLYMPLHIARLKRSKAWLTCKRRPELGFYMINLWSAAWHELPAASLEDDEDVLADRAMCPPKEWPIVREDVMRGWVKCSDGRLYHPVVVEIAQISWKSKLEQRYTRELGRIRKDNNRRKGDGIKPLPLPDFEDWNKARKNQHSTGNCSFSMGQSENSSGQIPFSMGQPPSVPVTSHGIPRDKGDFPAENALKLREGKVSEVAAPRPPVVPHEKSPLSRGKSPMSTGQAPDTSSSAARGPDDAWRDVTECDVQAYEAWLSYRAEAMDHVPPRVRIEHAKFLSSKGTPQQQREFVAHLVRLEFKRLRDPTPNGHGNGTRSPPSSSKPSRSIAELEDEAIARGIASGQTDAQIADDTMVQVARVSAMRSKLKPTPDTH